MRILCVYPLFPKSYWGHEYTMRLSEKRAVLPPLGLLTVAALLPPDWEIQLCDMNVEPLRPSRLEWADVVFLSGMILQRESLLEVARAARRAGKIVVVGGPYATMSPETLEPLVDCVVVGEAEELIAPLAELLSRGEKLPARMKARERPDIGQSPTPRFDLLRVQAYQSLSLQSSRGCPFKCEFCDIIEIFGRKPRLKTPEQISRELDALLATGYHGPVFVVDDNFIGNKRRAHALLEAIGAWTRMHGAPFGFYTQASVNLAADDALIEAMSKAGFSSVFLGIETPSTEALRQANKLQNTTVDIHAAVQKLTSRGFEVMGGFIVGFDSDTAQTLDEQRRWILESSVPLAMIGLLMALPGTQLERRLVREGRLLRDCSGDNFIRPNFVTMMDETELLEGYARLLEEVYTPRAYFARASRSLEVRGEDRTGYKLPLAYAVRCLLRSLYHQGVRGAYRRDYWSFLGRVLRRSPRRFAKAIRLAIVGEHMIRYTREDVLPRLRTNLEELRRLNIATAESQVACSNL